MVRPSPENSGSAPADYREAHRALALRKLDLDTTAALVRYAIRDTLVEN